MPMRRSGIVIFILFGMTRSVFAQLSQLSKEDMDTPAARVKGMGAPVKADRLHACSRESHSMPNWTCPAGHHRLRLAVRSTDTGFLGTTEIPLNLASK